MLVYATYLDNIDRGGYQPGIVTSCWNECDRRMLFVGDAGGMEHCGNVDAEIINIGHKISQPQDIPIAQNKCVNYCYDVIGADWVLYIQGDVVLRSSGDRSVAEWVSRGVRGAIRTMGATLYAYTWLGVVATLSHKDTPVVYDVRGDGANCGMIDDPGLIEHDGNIMWDIGYLGVPQYRAKMINHNHIWPSGGKREWLDMYGRNPTMAIQKVYANLRNETKMDIRPIDIEQYAEIVDCLGQMDDYGRCAELMG